MVIAKMAQEINSEIEKLTAVRELLLSLEYAKEENIPAFLKASIKHQVRRRKGRFSAKGRAAMVAAQKKRWAKWRKQNKKSGVV